MPTPLTYTSLQEALLVALTQAATPYTAIPPDFSALYDRSISYAESRICAEIPLLANRTQNATLSTTPNLRQINLSAMTNPLVVLERLSLITPASTTPSAGTRWPYVRTTLDFIDVVWPNESTAVAPDSISADQIGRYWAPLNTGSTSAAYAGSSSIIIIAPTPPSAYVAECTGLFQPPPLTSGNTATYLSTVYPDLLTAACMVFMEGALMRNFGAQSSDPNTANSWEQQYQHLKSACEFEEIRRRGGLPDRPRGAVQPVAAG
jgi:hypothetical protein